MQPRSSMDSDMIAETHTLRFLALDTEVFYRCLACFKRGLDVKLVNLVNRDTHKIQMSTFPQERMARDHPCCHVYVIRL